MFTFTALHTGTGEQRTVQAGTFQQAMQGALALWAGEQAKNIKVYPCVSLLEEQDASYYLSVQIAKTTARFINGKAPNKTQQAIVDDLDRLTGKYNHSPYAQESPLACTLFFTGAGNMQTATVLDRQTGMEKDIIVAPAQIGQNTQDFISWAYVGVRQGVVLMETGDGDLLGAVNMGFQSLNDYIDGERTINAHEVLTAYDLDTDTDGETVYTPVKTDIRRILRGLTEKEQQDGEKVRETQLAHAMQEVAGTLSPRQRDVWELLGKGKPVGDKRTGGKIGEHRGIYGVCKALKLNKKTVKEHIQAIAKKCLRNETICTQAYMKGYNLNGQGILSPVPHRKESPCIISRPVGFMDSRTVTACGNTLVFSHRQGYSGPNDILFYYSPYALHEVRQAEYNRLFCAEGKAPAQEQESPCPVSPVHSREYMEHLTGGVKYLLKPYAEYRQERQEMYNRLFCVRRVCIVSHEKYRQERQEMYNRLFHAEGQPTEQTAPAPRPLFLHKYSYRLYRESLYNMLWGNPYRVTTAWTAGQHIADYKYTGKTE